MYVAAAVLLLSLPALLYCSRRVVVRSTAEQQARGYMAALELGREIGRDAAAESPQACVARCQATPACRSVMLVGKECRMYAPPSTCPCFAALAPKGSPASRYLIGEDSRRSFSSAMRKCQSVGAHSAHINSQEEHHAVKDFIRSSGMRCQLIWLGGYSRRVGSDVMSDWHWYYGTDLTHPGLPFTYLKYPDGQPNNANGEQFYMGLDRKYDYDFNDLSENMDSFSCCYLCEC